MSRPDDFSLKRYGIVVGSPGLLLVGALSGCGVDPLAALCLDEGPPQTRCEDVIPPVLEEVSGQDGALFFGADGIDVSDQCGRFASTCGSPIRTSILLTPATSNVVDDLGPILVEAAQEDSAWLLPDGSGTKFQVLQPGRYAACASSSPAAVLDDRVECVLFDVEADVPALVLICPGKCHAISVVGDDFQADHDTCSFELDTDGTTSVPEWSPCNDS